MLKLLKIQTWVIAIFLWFVFFGCIISGVFELYKIMHGDYKLEGLPGVMFPLLEAGAISFAIVFVLPVSILMTYIAKRFNDRPLVAWKANLVFVSLIGLFGMRGIFMGSVDQTMWAVLPTLTLVITLVVELSLIKTKLNRMNINPIATDTGNSTPAR